MAEDGTKTRSGKTRRVDPDTGRVTYVSPDDGLSGALKRIVQGVAPILNPQNDRRRRHGTDGQSTDHDY